MKILHLAPNEKFIDTAAKQFEALFPGQNTFFIFTDAPLHDRTQFAQSTGRLETIGANDDRTEVLAQINSFDIVFLHSIYFKFARFIPETRRDLPIVWIFWGSEVYNTLPHAERRAIGPLTAAHRYRSSEVFLRALKALYDRFAMRINPRLQAKLNQGELANVIDRVDYVASYMKEDLDAIGRYVRLPTKRFWYAYSDLQQIVGEQNSFAQGNGILLGNSSTATNNHLEALERLALLDLNAHQIIAPLNYGEPAYRTFVLKQIPPSIKERFVPLTEFLTIEAYNAHLLQCPIAVMNHHRQQAVTTIIALFWFGTKIYLSERNPILQFYRRIGLHVCSIERDLVASNPTWNTPLTRAEVMHNRTILTGLLSREQILEQIKEGILEVQRNDRTKGER